MPGRVLLYLLLFLSSSCAAQEYLDTDGDIEEASLDVETPGEDSNDEVLIEEGSGEDDTSAGEATEESSGDELADSGSGSGEEAIDEEPETTTLESESETDPTDLSTEEDSCDSSPFGCCEEGEKRPAHGPEQVGCCAITEFGCCPDSKTPALGPYSEGCDCSVTEFGCCPDEITPARGEAYEGCGCQYSPNGCCPDQSTQAPGPNLEGCSCSTYEYGCCLDNETPAQGLNFEGCPECNSPLGCCPDGVTPRREDEECGCQASMHGCCLDGVTFATGPDFQGCGSMPGEHCDLPSETGPCHEYESKWFYDTEYGGCNRFWYGGCEAGRNQFDEEEACLKKCVSPKGSGICYLKTMSGPCDGNYREWHYDYQTKRCSQFAYSGCLGNDNRFSSQQDCLDACSIEDVRPVCSKPKVEGACEGSFPRWYFDQESGECAQFNYSGCRGNNNRFMTLNECESACKHTAKQLQTDRVCKLYIESGNCGDDKANSTLARWAYDERQRRCVPFYYTGCQGNDNNFGSRDECEVVCPTTFPAVISFPGGNEVLAERRSQNVVLPVSVRANPPATVTWIRQGQPISEYDSRFRMLDDSSLEIFSVGDLDAGKYTVTATNGIGQPDTKEIEVIVYPLMPSASIDMEKSIFKPGSDVTIPCSVRSYPPAEITWYRFETRFNTQSEVVEDRPHLSIHTYQAGTVLTESRLVISNATDGDSGNYRCTARAADDRNMKASDSEGIRIQYGPGERCFDSPAYKHCNQIVQHRLCGNKYYGQYCCRSCTNAGYVPGGET